MSTPRESKLETALRAISERKTDDANWMRRVAREALDESGIIHLGIGNSGEHFRCGGGGGTSTYQPRFVNCPACLKKAGVSE